MRTALKDALRASALAVSGLRGAVAGGETYPGRTPPYGEPGEPSMEPVPNTDRWRGPEPQEKSRLTGLFSF